MWHLYCWVLTDMINREEERKTNTRTSEVLNQVECISCCFATYCSLPVLSDALGCTPCTFSLYVIMRHDSHYTQGVKLLVRVFSKTATTATIQLCKYSTAASQCVFPVPTPPPVRRGDFRITMYDISRFASGSRLQFRFSWTPGTSRCYQIPNYNQWV